MIFVLHNCTFSLQIHTDVVSRKTTITTFPDITFYGSVNSSDNEEDMARGKRHVKRRRARRNAQTKLRNKSKVRNCDKCHNAVANDIDMYRFYHTGLTVCKNCWITMDPTSDKMQRRLRQVQSNLAETKLCAVFLTDVLSQGSRLKDKKKIQETEKDKDVYVSCDSSQEEAKSSEGSPVIISSRTRNHAFNGKARRGRKRRFDIEKSKDDAERTPSKMTRLSKERANMNETKSTKVSVDAEQQSSISIKKMRGRKRLIDNQSSDSDGFVEQRETRKSKMNDANKSHKKKPRSILEETTSNARSDSSDEMSNEDSMSLRNKTKDTSSVITPTKKEEDRSTRSRTRSSSISSVDITSAEFKNPKSLTSQSEVKTEYTCDKCNKKFDTKLSDAKHRLMHLKQAALKLEKLTVASIKEKETEVDLQDDKISEEVASYSSRTVSINKHTDDPLEDIAINIEDDTDDEEIFSLSNKQKKKQGEEISDKSDSVIDKSDVANSESRVEEESANDGNTKIKEQYKESTDERVALDETVSLEGDEDRQDKDIKDKHTMEDKDKIPANRDNDKSKDEDAQKTDVTTTEDNKNVDEEKDKDVEIEHDTDIEIENDIEVSSKEKEKTIGECNNDKKNLHEKTTCDNETTKSPILSTRNTTKDNKDHESCKNNLENNCEGDKDEIIEESEIIQCELTGDEFSKTDIKKPEEKARKILPVDKTETISDKKDVDDIINEDNVEALEEQQNKSDEEDMEVEMIADDKPNSAKDTIKPDLLNGGKHDEVKNDDEDDVTVVPNSDNNDDRLKDKNVTEEMVTTDDLKEKRKLEEEIRDLEKLVEDNETNNKHEVQENSNYVSDNNPMDAANEILKEVFELAAAEVQQREENSSTKNLDDVEMETLENISREIRKSADMPSLDPISIMEIDDDNDILLN